jgi:alpha,alpha-trehalose phosphorylase
MKQYISENFALDNDSLKLAETLFHNANGYLGVRGNFEEGYPQGYDSIRGTYINGFYDYASMPQAEKLYGLIEEKQTMLNVADTQGIELYVDGERFSLFEGTVISRKRCLDMEKGVTVREVCWKSPSGKTVKINVTRMASFKILPLFLIEYRVEAVDFSGEVRIVSAHNGDVRNYFDSKDPRVAGESFQHLYIESVDQEEGVSFVTSVTSKSGLKVTSAVNNRLELFDKDGNDRIVNRSTTQSDSGVVEEFTAAMSEDETLVLYKYTILCDSIRCADVKEEAARRMQQALAMNVAELYHDQETYLGRFWTDCSVEVQGDKELNEAINYNLYQLIQSAAKDPYCNIAAKGLSGEGYEGHYFWDTEMYLQPFFILNAREISKNLIRNRYSILEYAKENAKLLGHKKGAAFPWRTIMGKECSGYFPSGSAQYHISGDIAYSVTAYYLATKDLDLLKECGAEILIETARLWMDIGNYYKGQFHINAVTGPDEYTCLVNNNYYTNALAQHNLRWACKAVRLLSEAGMEEELIRKTGVTSQELAEFEEAADHMYLPYDEELGINPQDDSFLQKAVWDIASIKEEEKPLLLHYHPMYLYRYQVCKQADTVLAHFILEDAQDLETIRRSFAYYEKVTTHDSSLSTCIYSIVASRLGDRKKAYEYFGESAKLDLFNTHKNTKDGIHTANMGGTYMAIVYGFGGLRIKESGVYLNPQIPEQWTGYKFRFLFEDASIEVEAAQEGCTIRLLAGETKQIHVFGQKYMVTQGNDLTLTR